MNYIVQNNLTIDKDLIVQNKVRNQRYFSK